GHKNVQVVQLEPASNAIAQLHGGPHFRIEMISSDNSIMRLWLHQLTFQAQLQESPGLLAAPLQEEGALNSSRRTFVRLAAAAIALPAISRTAQAQVYPTRPVRIIVGFAAGGAPDILARLVGQWLSERLGQPFIIDNRPGAGSNIGTEAVVR